MILKIFQSFYLPGYFQTNNHNISLVFLGNFFKIEGLNQKNPNMHKLLEHFTL